MDRKRRCLIDVDQIGGAENPDTALTRFKDLASLKGTLGSILV
jgi:hypothetical protein